MNDEQRTIVALRRELAQVQQRLLQKEEALSGLLGEQSEVSRRLTQQQEEIEALRSAWLPFRVIVRRRAPNPYPVRAWVFRALDRVKQKVPKGGVKLVAESPLFDAEWYLHKYPELRSERKACSNPAAHYYHKGAAKGLNPGPGFDTQWYLANNPDVKATGINPLVHYTVHGMEEGRAPKP